MRGVADARGPSQARGRRAPTPKPLDRRGPAATTAGRTAEIALGYEKHLRAVARRILGDEDLAEDAVQEALVCLWQTRERPGALHGWLVRTVVHRSLHARRTRERRRRWEGEAGQALSDSCPLCEPETALDARRALRGLEAALASLPDEQRSVLVLHELDGLAYGEIATQLAMPVGTVRSRLHRARRELRARSAQSARQPAAWGTA